MSPQRESAQQPSQRERFIVRSRILRDTSISHGAARLFLLLDDEAWGEDGLAMKQSALAKTLGVKERQLRTLIQELSGGKYLRVERRVSGNVYDFHRQFTADYERQFSTGPTGNKLPVHLISKKQQEPPLPPTGGKCIKCRGRGRSGRCSECGGSGIRIVAPVSSGEWATPAELGL